MTQQHYFDKYLRLFSKHYPGYTVIKREAEAVSEAGSQYVQGTLLDIGSGGKTKEVLLGEFIDYYIGLDHPISFHDTSKLDIYGTAYEIPIADNSVDSVLCTSVLEHLEEPSQAIGEAYRVLKSEGYAIYTMPFFWHIHEAPRDFFRYSRYGLQYLFEKSGFEIVKIEALAGFWTTILSEFNYYLFSYKKTLDRFFLGWLINAIIRFNHLIMPHLDKGRLRRDAFTWAYLVIVRKP